MSADDEKTLWTSAGDDKTGCTSNGDDKSGCTSADDDKTGCTSADDGNIAQSPISLRYDSVKDAASEALWNRPFNPLFDKSNYDTLLWRCTEQCIKIRKEWIQFTE